MPDVQDGGGARFEGGPDEPIGWKYHMVHDCPLCGGVASPGRSLQAILNPCILHGKFEFACVACGQRMVFPADVFVEGLFDKLKERDYVYWGEILSKLSKREIFVEGWMERIRAANK